MISLTSALRARSSSALGVTNRSASTVVASVSPTAPFELGKALRKPPAGPGTPPRNSPPVSHPIAAGGGARR